MKKVATDNLVLEVTRKCNMNCAHCLRGNAEDKDISFDLIDILLDNIDSINMITFTGGEPSLNVKALKYFREQVIKREIFVGGFYIVTNGKENVLELVSEVLQLYAYCSECDPYDAQEFSGLALSLDNFHEAVPIFHKNILKGLAFFRDDKIINFSEELIINEGRALENKIGNKNLEYNNICSVSVDSDKKVVQAEDIVYINVNGDVILDCDLSYSSQGKFKIGNLFNGNLSDILLDYSKIAA